MSSTKKIVLQSSDGEIFEVEESVAMESQTLKHMIEDDCANSSIPVPKVTGQILAKVIEYCKRHAAADDSNNSSDGGAAAAATAAAADNLKAFDAEFINVDQYTLFDLILAANYLDVKKLLDLSCQTVADMIKDKSVEEIRKIFNIKNDFTPEEEALISKENAWGF